MIAGARRARTRALQSESTSFSGDGPTSEVMCNRALDYALACEPISDEEAFRRYGYPIDCEDCGPEVEAEPTAEDPNPRSGWTPEETLHWDLHLIAIMYDDTPDGRDAAGEAREVRLEAYRSGISIRIHRREHSMQDGYA